MHTLRPLVVINVVGLTHSMLGPDTPNISAVAADGFARPLGTVLPAVTMALAAAADPAHAAADVPAYRVTDVSWKLLKLVVSYVPYVRERVWSVPRRRTD